MLEHIGVWIDQRNAVLVRILGERNLVQRMSRSDAKAASTDKRTHTNQGERRRASHMKESLAQFHTQIAEATKNAESIALAGPASDKEDLARRLGNRVVSVETMEKANKNRLIDHFREILIPNFEKDAGQALTRREVKSRRNSKSPGPSATRRRTTKSAKPAATVPQERSQGSAAQIAAGESPETRRVIRRGVGRKNIYANMPGKRKER